MADEYADLKTTIKESYRDVGGALGKEIRTYLDGQGIAKSSEVFVIKNDKTGLHVECQSSRMSFKELSELGIERYKQILNQSNNQSNKIPLMVT